MALEKVSATITPKNNLINIHNGFYNNRGVIECEF